jgi:uncharacterized protein (UPF0261 family)/ABC-type branched-subunit amino acid transport system ATPase component
MAERAAPVLQVEALHVYYGESHALQGVSFTLDGGILAVVGRNGMGKTTLCHTIIGLVRARSGAVRFNGVDVLSLHPHQVTRLGIGFVPQRRLLWPSLTVDETLRLCALRRSGGLWTVERIYQTFPRLAERRRHGGAQLSGGEQQMLAISRALLSNPKLLIMDEPTEGLAPAIVEQVKEMLHRLETEQNLSVLLVEQNLGVATAVSEQVAIMVNGSINRIMDSRALAADRDLQQRLLGVGRHGDEDILAAPAPLGEPALTVLRVERHGAAEAAETNPVFRPIVAVPNRWGVEAAGSRTEATNAQDQDQARTIFAVPLAERVGRTALVVGTFDTKGNELRYVRDRLRAREIPVKTVDLSTSGKPSTADVTPMQVAALHPQGSSAVFSADRGQSVAAMAEAFAGWIDRERGIGGVISAGGSGGTTLATAGMRRLPLGIPKIMVSTVASGAVGHYVGPSDIMMMHSVADVQGINAITEQVLSNAANALAGMIAGLPCAEAREARRRQGRPAVGITMFGVTTPCVVQVARQLEPDFDCVVFHATGIGGRSMEHLGDSGLLSAFIDVTTTEVADMLVGGVFPADRDRFGAPIRTGLPYVGSVGAVDMVNFGPRETVPAQFRTRKLISHNPNVTLMRTTRDENREIGEWIGSRLNQMQGAVRFLLPEGGVSLLDAPGQPFHDPEADDALFTAIERTVRPTAQRHVARVRANINDAEFARAVVDAFAAITPRDRASRMARPRWS